MKCKQLEKIAPVQPGRKAEYIITVQTAREILLLDVFRKNVYRGRHAINAESGEYAQYDPESGKWRRRKFGNLLDLDMSIAGYYSYQSATERTNIDTKSMEQTIRSSMLKKMTKIHYIPEIFYLIDQKESDYDKNQRRRIEDNRVMKIQRKMGMVPEMPEKAREWIWQMEGAEDFLFRDKAGAWHCSACGEAHQAHALRREDGGEKIRHNDRVICTKCRKTVTAKTRTSHMEKKSRFYMAQRMDDRMSVWRSFDTAMEWDVNGRKIWINESSRIIMYHLSVRAKYAGEIFYNQYPSSGSNDDREYAYFDNKRNPAQRRMGKAYIYPWGIEEALEDTAYQRCGKIISQMAAEGTKLDYNRLISTQGAYKILGIVEYLYKGRFRRLLEETVDNIVFYGSQYYYGCLNIGGITIEEIFGISDRQLINRIREMDGGENAVEWMRWSEATGSKISQETLQWMKKNKIEPDDIKFLRGRMTPQQIMNYITRQQAEEYKGKTACQVMDQWEDYMDMLDRLGRKTDDEMMYRPRQLKRRHDECVEEINVQRIRNEMARDPEKREREAAKMNKRFPGAEKVLAEIREKYEYGDDQYLITVPHSLMDIITEGQALHHCAGATDRYFDRIMQHETYICFLRKKEDPDTPYYTIEVEPGGTIRQHRGYMDEEPNIEQIKPFLRKWQQEIQKRLTREDKKHAAASAIKRQQNIEELKANRNTRVLQGLMEDFMPQEIGESIPGDILMAGA